MRDDTIICIVQHFTWSFQGLLSSSYNVRVPPIIHKRSPLISKDSVSFKAGLKYFPNFVLNTVFWYLLRQFYGLVSTLIALIQQNSFRAWKNLTLKTPPKSCTRWPKIICPKTAWYPIQIICHQIFGMNHQVLFSTIWMKLEIKKNVYWSCGKKKSPIFPRPMRVALSND